jgi:hypothetical protein
VGLGSVVRRQSALGEEPSEAVKLPVDLLISARLLLHDTERHPKRDSQTSSAGHFKPQGLENDIAANVLKLAESLKMHGHCGTEEVSPLCLEAIYRSGIIYAQRHNSERNENDVEAFETIKSCLEILSRRWKAAGESFLVYWMTFAK